MDVEEKEAGWAKSGARTSQMPGIKDKDSTGHGYQRSGMDTSSWKSFLRVSS